MADDNLVEPHLKDGSLERVLGDYEMPLMFISAVDLPSRTSSLAIRALVAISRRRFGQCLDARPSVQTAAEGIAANPVLEAVSCSDCVSRIAPVASRGCSVCEPLHLPYARKTGRDGLGVLLDPLIERLHQWT